MKKEAKVISEQEMRQITAKEINNLLKKLGEPESEYQKGFQEGLKYITEVFTSKATNEYIDGLFSAITQLLTPTTSSND